MMKRSKTPGHWASQSKQFQAKTHLDSGYLVSTVQLGPDAYETMVFKRLGTVPGRYSYSEVWVRQSAAEHNAKEYHMDAIHQYHGGLPFKTEPVKE